jgi:DNA-binding MarR family transcriptional regulator
MQEITGPDLCHCLAARRNARHMTRLYDRHLVSSGLSISQFSALALIEAHPSISVLALSEMMVMERTTLLRALKPLRNAGFLLCEPGGAKFALEFTLSAAGKAKLMEAEPLWQAAQGEFEAYAGKQRAAQLRAELLGVVFPKQ